MLRFSLFNYEYLYISVDLYIRKLIVFCLNSGEIVLENVKQEDFEDIALASSSENDVDYIYVGDIGNNWKGHCKGINEPNKRIYKFPEPSFNLYRYY